MRRARPLHNVGTRCWALALVALILTPLVALSSEASAAAKPHGTLTFSGYTWTIKKSGAHRVGPGPNYFSKKNAWVDSSGRLHLAITKVGRHWAVGEVVNTRSLGYGTYTWVLASRVDNLDPNMVLGLFTYDSNPAYNNREIDIEASRSGQCVGPHQRAIRRAALPTNCQPASDHPGIVATRHAVVHVDFDRPVILRPGSNSGDVDIHGPR